MSREEVINQLYDTIKAKFEEDGILQEVRCLLQSKLVAMMTGKNDVNALGQRPQTISATGGDTHLMLLNQLIMEYLHWHGFHYTAEMLSLESACDNAKPMRQCLEGVMGNFDHKDVPILIQIVGDAVEKNNNE